MAQKGEGDSCLGTRGGGDLSTKGKISMADPGQEQKRFTHASPPRPGGKIQGEDISIERRECHFRYGPLSHDLIMAAKIPCLTVDLCDKNNNLFCMNLPFFKIVTWTGHPHCPVFKRLKCYLFFSFMRALLVAWPLLHNPKAKISFIINERYSDILGSSSIGREPSTLLT